MSSTKFSIYARNEHLVGSVAVILYVEFAYNDVIVRLWRNNLTNPAGIGVAKVAVAYGQRPDDIKVTL